MPTVFDVPFQDGNRRQWSIVTRVLEDHQQQYSVGSLLNLTSGILVAAPIANTKADHAIGRTIESMLGGSRADEWTRYAKPFGNGKYTLPTMAVAWGLGYQLPGKAGPRVSEWGERSLRTFVIGAPVLVAGQLLTGGSRPGEIPSGSRWHPFQDDNGMSGHSFMGSLLWINAAKATDDRRYKTLFYSVSAITPLSRVADQAHYPSQAFLGWWVAYVSATAVDRSWNAERSLSCLPCAPDGSSGLSFELNY